MESSLLWVTGRTRRPRATRSQWQRCGGPKQAFLLRLSLDFKEPDWAAVPSARASEMTPRSSARSPALLNGSVALASFLSAGRLRAGVVMVNARDGDLFLSRARS